MGSRRLTWQVMSLSMLLLIISAGCGHDSPFIVSGSDTTQPPPTVSAAFAPQIIPQSQSLPATPIPFSPLSDPHPDDAGEQKIKTIPIYDDTLDANWTLEHSFQINYNLRSTAFVDKGSYSIQAQPMVTTGILYFTLKPGVKKSFRRDQVIGFQFRLSGGSLSIDKDAILVTVTGSNKYSYWVENDKSVTIDGITSESTVFSETRLSFLNIQNTIQPRTWVDVEITLDDLIYDPDYKYVTGLYLKTDRQTQPAFFVDQVNILVYADGNTN